MGFSLRRAFGFIAAPFTGGASLAATEGDYQADKAAKKQEQAQAAIIQAEADAKEEAKKKGGQAILARKQSMRTGSLLGGYQSSSDSQKTLLGQ